ncbi:MAG TPA: YrdB family protein [Acidimicrobiales bacterium]|nr:YrdB family protein [Acidimicrobiales bacterium]
MSPPHRDGGTTGAAGANLALRFLVELAAFASYGYWGASITAPVAVRAVLGALGPLAAMVVWSQFLSPKARWRLADPAALVAESTLFTVASIGLALSGQAAFGAGFEVVALANAVLVRRLAHTSPEAPVAGSRPVR